MKKLLSIGLLLSLSIGSVQALSVPKYVPASYNYKGLAQQSVPKPFINAVSKTVPQDRLAIGKAKVAGLKAQAQALKKDAIKSPVVENVLEKKRAKLATAQETVQKAATKVKEAASAPIKEVGSWFN